MNNLILDSAGGGGSDTPSVRLPNIGDSIVFALYDVEEIPLTDFETGEVVLNDQGKERTQKLIFGIVTDPGTAEVGADRLPAAIGDRVCVYAGRGTLWEWVEALKELKETTGTDGVGLGDRIRFYFDREEPSTKRGLNPRKIRTFAIRKAQAGEEDMIAKCKQAHLERKQGGALDTPTPTAPAAPAPAPAAPAPAPAPVVPPSAPAAHTQEIPF